MDNVFLQQVQKQQNQKEKKDIECKLMIYLSMYDAYKMNNDPMFCVGALRVKTRPELPVKRNKNRYR